MIVIPFSTKRQQYVLDPDLIEAMLHAGMVEPIDDGPFGDEALDGHESLWSVTPPGTAIGHTGALARADFR